VKRIAVTAGFCAALLVAACGSSTTAPAAAPILNFQCRVTGPDSFSLVISNPGSAPISLFDVTAVFYPSSGAALGSESYDVNETVPPGSVPWNDQEIFYSSLDADTATDAATCRVVSWDPS
jgi:hypothetical protein